MTKFRGGLPALKWLAKKDAVAALAVLKHLQANDNQRIHQDKKDTWLDPRDQSSDDSEAFEIYSDDDESGVMEIGEAPISSNAMSSQTQAGPDELHGEMLHEVQPSINVMLADLLRVRVTRMADGVVHRVDGLATSPVFNGDRAYLAGMDFTFQENAPVRQVGGTMLYFTDLEGRKKETAITVNKPRGGKRPIRTAQQAASYLSQPEAAQSPLQASSYLRPLSGEAALMPMMNALPQVVPSLHNKRGRYGVHEARILLQSMGIDGAVSFSDLPVTATKCPTAIARNARFMGGITALKETKSNPVYGKWEPEQPDISDASRVVLDELQARGTLTDIGLRLGYKGGYADRAGGKAVMTAGKELIAANENKIQKIAA